MYARFKIVGIGLAIAGIAFMGVGAYTYTKTQAGANALNAFSTAQNVKLTYNDQGQLTDRGTVEGAAPILALLKDDWGYTVDPNELNPNDPVVNTASEYMVQMATIAHHTLDSTQTVVLDKPVTYNGKTYAAGEYQVPVDGRYFSQFDRLSPLDGPARAQAWSPLAHALIAELGVGSVTASTLQMGYGLAGLFAALGGTIILTGGGLIWAVRAPAKEKVPAFKPAPIPA